MNAVEVPNLYPSEPLPVRLMNTIWADRDGVHDALSSLAQLREWAKISGLPGAARLKTADLDQARELRDALRRLAAVATSDDRTAAVAAMPDVAATLATVNRFATPLTPVLTQGSDGHFRLRWETDASGIAQHLSAMVLEFAEIVSAPDMRLRACHGPGCVLYFVKDHPRREWCSAGCGNRARVARHYRRHRRG